jgi:hypothetical protein
MNMQNKYYNAHARHWRGQFAASHGIHDAHGQVNERISDELRNKQLQRRGMKAGCVIQRAAIPETVTVQ